MTRYQYYVASSLDGFIADRNGRIDWLLAFGFEDYAEHYERFIAGIGAIVMGASTYRFLLDAGPDAWTYDVPAFVLTHRTPPTVPGKDIRFRSGDVAALHAELAAAAGDRDVWVVGGGGVAADFADAGMLHDLFVTVMPLALGAGSPLLPVGRDLALTLTGTTPFPSGAVELAYRLDTPPR
ncbi:MAG: dihydrofolate reductase family protein [Actinomycetota bacterium]